MPRRRTRSRRTTRRLHRTRRHRIRRQFGGAEGDRKELTEWLSVVNQKRAVIAETTADLLYSIPEKLKSEELTLTRENAPLLPSIAGKSEFAPAGDQQGAQTLLAAAASMVEQLGADTFSSPKTFKDQITTLSGDPNSSVKPLLDFMAELEKRLRSAPDAIDLTDETIYPLFIWYAVANYNTADTEESLVPILSDEAGTETTSPTTAPSPLAE